MRSVTLLAAVMTLLHGLPSRADGPPEAQIDALFAAMYDFTVCDYCGLVTSDVHEGFHRQIGDLVAEHGLDEAAVRRARIRAWTAADLEHGNRGLGGFRGWCRTEGAAAAARFVAYRAAALEREADGRR